VEPRPDKKNKSISQLVIWPADQGPPLGSHSSGAQVPRDSVLAWGDNNCPDVITSAARELEISQGLLMGSRYQINNLFGRSYTKEVYISIKGQISFL
jgi:hypothetical protein